MTVNSASWMPTVLSVRIPAMVVEATQVCSFPSSVFPATDKPWMTSSLRVWTKRDGMGVLTKDAFVARWNLIFMLTCMIPQPAKTPVLPAEVIHPMLRVVNPTIP